jgi:S-adenosylmethionine synthetase
MNAQKASQILRAYKTLIQEKSGHLISSESVGRGHPDKIADQVSDLVVDAYLAADPESRVAVETAVKDSEIMLFGEVKGRNSPIAELPELIRRHVADSIGFNRGELGLDGNTCSVSLRIGSQSSEITSGTREATEVGDDGQGAGDQGLMWGYATNETPEYMPLAHVNAHKLVRRLNQLMDDTPSLGLRPDNKSQITVEFNRDGKPVRIGAVVVAQQHAPNVLQADIEKIVRAACA